MMPDTILTAGITAGATVLAAALPYVFKSIAERRRFTDSPRADAISGTWTGDGEDFYAESSKQFYGFKLNLTFRKHGRKIDATGELKAVDPSMNTKIVLAGGFFNDDY